MQMAFKLERDTRAQVANGSVHRPNRQSLHSVIERATKKELRSMVAPFLISPLSVFTRWRHDHGHFSVDEEDALSGHSLSLVVVGLSRK